jgi:hypothetical protein
LLEGGKCGGGYFAYCVGKLANIVVEEFFALAKQKLPVKGRGGDVVAAKQKVHVILFQSQRKYNLSSKPTLGTVSLQMLLFSFFAFFSF